MFGTWLGLRQARGRRRAIGTLPEDRQIALAVGLKRDTLTVRGPDGKPIVSFERELSGGLGAGQLVDPEVRALAVVGSNGDLSPVGRHTRRSVWPCRKLQRLH